MVVAVVVDFAYVKEVAEGWTWVRVLVASGHLALAAAAVSEDPSGDLAVVPPFEEGQAHPHRPCHRLQSASSQMSQGPSPKMWAIVAPDEVVHGIRKIRLCRKRKAVQVAPASLSHPQTLDTIHSETQRQ